MTTMAWLALGAWTLAALTLMSLPANPIGYWLLRLACVLGLVSITATLVGPSA